MSASPLSLSPLSLPPLSLYVHIPWCVKKCPYCDFNSHESKTIPEKEYIAALLNDLQQDYAWVQGRKLTSIFFGGGTPSLFSANSIDAILTSAEKTIGFEDNIEITLEANPGTFEQEKFSGFYQAGVNRLSIGIQSFQEQHLKKLGRIHNSNEAISAVAMAKAAGFTNFNLDLMHGLPNQTMDEALSDLQTAIDLEPQHISWYQLTIEPNTVFFREQPRLPVDDVLADIQAQGEKLLADHGFQQYEVSAFSQIGKQSKHNLNYWSFGDYIGIGSGAHGKFTDIKNNRILRRQKTRLPDHYLSNKTAPSFKEKTVEPADLTLEFMMNVLRLKEGVPYHYFAERTGLKINAATEPLKKLINQGLIAEDEIQLKTTPLGQQFLNSVLAQLMDH